MAAAARIVPNRSSEPGSLRGDRSLHRDEFARGTLGSTLVSARAGYRAPLEIVGETSSLRADDALSVERPINLEIRRGGVVVGEETVSNADAYARQVDAFSAAMEGHSEFPVPGEEGWQNQEVPDAAYRSGKSGKAEAVPRVERVA